MKTTISEKDIEMLQHAVRLAAEGIKKGGGPFGAVITRDGIIISEAYNEVVYSSDPTAHAEVLAIRKACELLNTHDLKGCVLYASCEPCPMCFGAIYWSGLSKVYFASNRNDAAAAGFGDELFYRELALDPPSRKIPFIQVSKVDGSGVFRLWDDYENKTPY